MHPNLKLWIASFCMAILSMNVSFAQTCDNACPANNLVVNGDFQSGYTGFTHPNYANDCSCDDNSICVAAQAYDKCTNFINNLYDHTFGTPAGRYLVVDGRSTSTPGNAFWKSTATVTGGKTYTFSFWLLPQVSNFTAASMQLYVDGSPIGSVITGTGQNWEEHCATWTATSNATVDIEIRQTTYGFLGWDFGIDDIFFGSCDDPCEVEAKWDVQEEDCVFSFFDFSNPGNASTQIVGWQWKFGDGCSSNEQNPTHVYETPGSYEVCLTVTALNPETGECCSSELCHKIQVECEPSECKLEADFDWLVCDPCVYTFNGNIIFANRNIAGWFWDFGDGSTGVGQNPQHVFPGPGTYNVCLTVVAFDREGRCCTFTVCRKVSVECEGRQKFESDNTLEPLEENSFMMFPNPMNDQTTIAYTLENATNVHLQVNDMQGRTVKVLVNETQGEGQYQINLNASDMPSGAYFVTFRTKAQSDVQKLIIQH